MTKSSNDAITKLCHRLIRNPYKATVDDVRKIVRAWLLDKEGRLPQ